MGNYWPGVGFPRGLIAGGLLAGGLLAGGYWPVVIWPDTFRHWHTEIFEKRNLVIIS